MKNKFKFKRETGTHFTDFALSLTLQFFAFVRSIR